MSKVRSAYTGEYLTVRLEMLRKRPGTRYHYPLVPLPLTVVLTKRAGYAHAD